MVFSNITLSRMLSNFEGCIVDRRQEAQGNFQAGVTSDGLIVQACELSHVRSERAVFGRILRHLSLQPET